MKLAKTVRTKVTRQAKRACYDKDYIEEAIDQIVIGHLAFESHGSLHSIPMPFRRCDQAIYCHCSVASRLVNLANDSRPVCISFAVVDGLVLAKSALHHSMNYRSVIVYGEFELVEDEAEKLMAMREFVEWSGKGRWDLVRQPSRKELNATAVLKLSLKEAVAKRRQGFANEKKSDLKRPVWSGIIPYLHQYGEPEEFRGE